MNTHTSVTVPYKRIVVVSLLLVALTATAASSVGPSVSADGTGSIQDGQGDFDWEIGTWHTEVRLLANPLSESADQWLSFEGTTRVVPLLDGRENVVELKVHGTSGRIEALNLRLYEPQADRWSLTFVNVRDGLLTPAVFGGFHDDVGEFYGDDQLDGRPIKVRFLIFRQGPNKARFEQAFSDDGGATWETNWIAVDKRI